MYIVNVEDSFSSAHKLRNYNGKCENLHGHNWLVKIYIASETLDRSGMVIDFTILKKFLKDITNELDHKYLNDITPFDTQEPSAENISYFIFKKLEKLVDNINKTAFVYKVEVWESVKSCASYINQKKVLLNV